jgi:3-methyladenine DNA glycosylase/8-oxoguanine DNA glycosylase
VKLHLAVPSDFSFLECVNAHGWKSLLPFSWDAVTSTLTRGEQFAGCAPSLMSIYDDGEAVVVEVEGKVPAEEAIHRASRILQFDLLMAGFHDYCSASESLQHVPALKQGRLLRSPTVYEDVLKVIATTNTTWAQTKGMVSRVVSGFGSPLPNDPLRHTFPTPEQIASVSLVHFAEIARMGYRSVAVHKIATDIAEGRLNVELWNSLDMPPDELYKEILSLPGVGPYAASCLMIYLGRYDRVNVDSWARTLVGKELGRKVTDKEVHEFFDHHGEWKALVYHFYPWRKDESAP